MSLVEYLCPRLYKELLEHGYSCSHTPDQETWEGPNCGPEWWFREWEGMVFQVIIENLPGEDPFGRMHVVAPHGHLELGKIDLLSLRKRFAYYEAKLAMMSLVAGGRPTILKGLATAREMGQVLDVLQEFCHVADEAKRVSSDLSDVPQAV